MENPGGTGGNRSRAGKGGLLRWYWDLLNYKVYSNLAAEATRTYLSLAWWVLEPLFLTLVYYIVFGLFLPFDREHFIPNLIVGVMVWQWFNRSVMNSTRSITNSGALLTRININRLFMTVVGIVTDSIKMAVILVAVALIVSGMGYPVSSAYVFLPFVIIVQGVFIAATASWAALLVPFADDLRNLIGLLMIGGMLASGVFYTVDQLPSEMRDTFLLNPMAALITAYRSIFVEAQVPDLARITVILVCSVFVLWLAIRFERRYRSTYTRLLVR